MTNILTGESSANDIYRLQGGDLFMPHGTNVAQVRDIWPVLGEHGTAELVNFGKGNRPHSGALKPETESADATKEVEYSHSSFLPTAFTDS